MDGSQPTPHGGLHEKSNLREPPRQSRGISYWIISWSGEPSHAVATALKEWFADVLPGVESFLSSEDLRKGNRWRNTLTSELAGSKFGVICLTHSNLAAPWVLFEAGSISSAFEDSQVCTLLLGGLKPSDVKDPLATFNHTIFEKEDMRKLAESINAGAGSGARDPASLNRSFDKFWSDLEERVRMAVEAAPNTLSAPTRTSTEMLEEVVERLRSMEKLGAGRTASGVERRVPSIMHDAYWTKFLEQLSIQSPTLYDMVRTGHLVGIVDQCFFVSVSEEFRREHGTGLFQPPAQAILNWAASQIFGAPLQVMITSPIPPQGWLTKEITDANRKARAGLPSAE